MTCMPPISTRSTSRASLSSCYRQSISLRSTAAAQRGSQRGHGTNPDTEVTNHFWFVTSCVTVRRTAPCGRKVTCSPESQMSGLDLVGGHLQERQQGFDSESCCVSMKLAVPNENPTARSWQSHVSLGAARRPCACAGCALRRSELRWRQRGNRACVNPQHVGGSRHEPRRKASR